MTDAIVLQAPLSIALYDAEGRLAFGNAAYERHFGIRVADVPPTFSLFTDPQLAASGLLEPIRRAYMGTPVVLPPVRYDAAQAAEGAGRTVWTEGHCFPLVGPAGEVTHLAIVHLDVTAWANTDAALREATASSEQARARAEEERARLGEIIAQLPAAIAVYEGADLRVRAMSAAYQRMIGGRDALGAPVRDVLTDLEGQGFFEQMERVVSTGEAVRGTDVAARWDADGDGEPESHIVDFAYGPLLDASGTPNGVVALVTDVSERARLREAERAALAAADASAVRLAAVLDALPDAAAVYDLDWRVTYMNPAAREMHDVVVRAAGRDMAADAVIGSVLWELYPWLVGTPVEAGLRRAAREQRVAEQVRFVDSLQRWFEMRIIPIATGVVTLIRDVTTQRTMEIERQQLHEAELRVTEQQAALLMQDITARRREQDAARFMAEASRLLAMSLDYEVTLRAVADAAVPQLGDWCAVDIIQHAPQARHSSSAPVVERLAVVHRDEAKRAIALELSERYPTDWTASAGIATVLRDAASLYIPELTDAMLAAGARDGEHLRMLRALDLASLLVVPLVAHGVTLGAISLGMSGASTRRYDERDLALAQDLAQRAAIAVDNARHFRDAERARTEAEEANRTKSQFLATMSHELRTPLNAIAGHVQLIDLELHGPVTPAQRDALTRVDRAQRHLLGLINDVLSFARLESGYVEYQVESVDVADVVHDIVPMVEPQLRAQGLQFSVVLGDSGAASPRVLADREKLGQVLLNLLSNAIKFTPSGGSVTLEVAERADGDGPRDIVFLRVRDTGIGIPPDKLEAIFDPFVQVRTNPYMPSGGGTGLGLAISRDLARGMGGDLRARSALGKGSAFTVSLWRGEAR